MVLSILMPIVMYDVLDSEYSTELILDFDYAGEDYLSESRYS